MKKFKSLIIFLILATILPKMSVCFAQRLETHTIVTDGSGKIIPWYSPNNGLAYDHNLDILWSWWQNNPMPNIHGIPNYMESCYPYHTRIGIASDQHGWTLHSWKLLYAYTGNSAILANAEYIANFVIDYGLSSSSCKWPDLMFQGNRKLGMSPGPGFYDGDVYYGKDILMPHVGGNFANELVDLYKITGKTKYLNAAIKAANTLAYKMISGDKDDSPWPFRVNAVTDVTYTDCVGVKFSYTTCFAPILELFTKLIDLKQGNINGYSSARSTCIAWLKKYPVQTNRWGNYFEDDWSGFGSTNISNQTETNADTFAKWILENDSLWDSNSLKDVRDILNWSYNTLGLPNWKGTNWKMYGVVPIGEETRELPDYASNSHTARHYAVELRYAEKSGDWSKKDEAVRGLNWATYMVDTIGRNTYPVGDNIWYTDGYGDYIRHYLVAMAASPDLAYDGEDHLLRSTSVVKSITYSSKSISYTTYDNASAEVLRITFSPSSVTTGGVALTKLSSVSAFDTQQGYTFEAPGDTSGVLRIRHNKSGIIKIHK